MTERTISSAIELVTPLEIGQLIYIYRQAFRESLVWREDLSEETVTQRINTQFAKKGFTLFISKVSDRINGALWYDTPNLAELETERGKLLADFASQTIGSSALVKIVWEREIIVDPQFQGQGIATQLRQRFLQSLETNCLQGALILTRMRNDNLAIIKVAEKCGYQRTGIETDSNWRPPMKNSYWFKKVNF